MNISNEAKQAAEAMRGHCKRNKMDDSWLTFDNVLIFIQDAIDTTRATDAQTIADLRAAVAVKDAALRDATTWMRNYRDKFGRLTPSWLVPAESALALAPVAGKAYSSVENPS
jgi:hypothetical protein